MLRNRHSNSFLKKTTMTTTTTNTTTEEPPPHGHHDIGPNDDNSSLPHSDATASAASASAPRQVLRVGFADLYPSSNGVSHNGVSNNTNKSSVPPAKESSTSWFGATTAPTSSATPFLEEPEHVEEDLQSVGSASCTSSVATHPPKAALLTSKYGAKYVPPPVVPPSVVLAIGLVCFVLAHVWPPLLLLVTYVLYKLVPYSFRLNDDASYRRQRYREFAQQVEMHPDKFSSPPSNIRIEESYWVNDRGMALSTMIMRPACAPPSGDESSDAADNCRSPSTSSTSPTATSVRAVVCLCHGYSDDLGYSKKVEYQRMAEAGIAVVGIEYEGHGRSDGPLCLIEDWDRMVDDVATFFQETVQLHFRGVPVFLMGESMGGAVAYSVHHRTPDLYQGVVFVCPMCKISDDMLPPQYVIDALKWIVGPTGSPSSWIGRLPLAPSKSDLYEAAHHVPAKAENMYRCPTTYGRNPRLATARELLHATSKISASLKEFDAPFLILHGREDRVTDPQLSLGLYRESKSVDKSIRLYDGMWHGITSTEPDESIDRVFRDCIEWIVERA